MTVFVETDQFKQMISYKPYAASKNEKRKVKYDLLDPIKKKIGDTWNRYKEGSRQAVDMICFLGAELGFFYASDEYLAARHEISERTIQYKLKDLVDLGQVIKVYRRAKKCNGRGKPIYLFVNHPYFKYWVELLGLNLADCVTDCETENAEIPCDSKDWDTKKIPTYSLPKKQERDIILGDNKIVQYVANRVNDAIKKGSTIKYISSYVDRAFRSLERQALYAENNRQKAIRKRQQEEIREYIGVKDPAPVFYNWLEQ